MDTFEFYYIRDARDMKELSEKCNEMGKEGWEVVNVAIIVNSKPHSSLSSYDGYYHESHEVYLKRKNYKEKKDEN